MNRAVLVLYDQLRTDHPLLTEGSRSETAVVFIESAWKPAQRRHHKQNLALVLSAQRHFARRLAEQGHPVIYHFTTGDFAEGAGEVCAEFGFPTLAAAQPAEQEVRHQLESSSRVRLVPNPFFITPAVLYKRTFRGKIERSLEPFYRNARAQTKLLMDGRKPEGGKWGATTEPPPLTAKVEVPPSPSFDPDGITREVMKLVETRYSESFGSLDGFSWPVSHEDAASAFEHFLAHRLPHFAEYEDAIDDEHPQLFHSFLAPLLHLGLLSPLEACERVDREYRDGRVSLASAERFIRNVLGAREFVRHLFEEFQELCESTNVLDAAVPVPSWFGTADSGMNCVDAALRHVAASGMSTHATRLHVLANIATLLEVNPQRLRDWFWSAHVDAFEWAVTPTVIAAAWADGGAFSGKPSMSAAPAIKKRGSGVCERCQYDPDELLGELACPFNSLYWSFINRHREILASQPRMPSIAQQYDRFGAEKSAAVEAKADDLRDLLRR